MRGTRLEGLAAALLALLLVVAVTAPLCLSRLHRERPIAPAAQTLGHRVSAGDALLPS